MSNDSLNISSSQKRQTISLKNPPKNIHINSYGNEKKTSRGFNRIETNKDISSSIEESLRGRNSIPVRNNFSIDAIDAFKLVNKEPESSYKLRCLLSIIEKFPSIPPKQLMHYLHKHKGRDKELAKRLSKIIYTTVAGFRLARFSEAVKSSISIIENKDISENNHSPEA